MKVTGPNLGPSPESERPDAGTGIRATEDPGKAEGTSPVGGGEAPTSERAEASGKAFAERLAAAAPPTPSPPPPSHASPGTGAHPTSGTSAIAAEVEAGRLTPKAAVEKVLEQVLSRQVGADAPPALRERVRAALEDALENDPLLAEKLRRLDD